MVIAVVVILVFQVMQLKLGYRLDVDIIILPQGGEESRISCLSSFDWRSSELGALCQANPTRISGRERENVLHVQISPICHMVSMEIAFHFFPYLLYILYDIYGLSQACVDTAVASTIHFSLHPIHIYTHSLPHPDSHSSPHSLSLFLNYHSPTHLFFSLRSSLSTIFLIPLTLAHSHFI